MIVLLGLLHPCVAEEWLLRTAAEVNQLTEAEARQGLSVRLQGVITFAWHTGTTEFTLEDGSGAIWCPAIALPFDCRVGIRVELEGRTDAGVFGSFVHALAIRPLGPSELPKPRRSTFEELLSTQLNGRRVEITGIVRGQRMNPELGLDWLALEVATGGGRITVNITHEATGHPELIDALVHIRGVNLHATDTQQQAFLPMIYAYSMADIELVKPANPAPFDQAPAPLADLMRSANVAGAGHRVRARGVVTYAGAGNSFYLQDSSRGIQVFPRETLRPIPLETIDVVGFPEPGAFSPVLRDADWRPAASTNVPAPLRVPIREATRYDGRLITIEGRLTEISDRDQETILTLEDGTFRSQAHLSDKASPKWRLGSVVRATGVCSVEIGDWESFVAHRRPVGFSLLVQNSSAIEVVKSAPWLTLNRLAWLLAFLGLGLCCSFGAIWWQAKLRLREATRTRDAAQAQFSAVLSERTRIAREIHDTLAQGLTGISAQLEVLNNRIHLPSSNWARHLDIARELVKGSLDEARRSVWNLRSQALEEAGLSEALDRLGRQLIEGSGVALNSTVAGEPRILPSEVENNLLRIGQEAITNAVRHAEASLISVTLSYLANQVRLEVCDDGKGVDLNHRAPSVQGGFGLAGMQERAHAMHASLTIVRGETRGTRVEITIPHV